MNDNFSLKTIRINLMLGKGTFSSTGSSMKVLEGLACDVTIDKPGLPDKNKASLKIWGLTLNDMAQMTMLSFQPLESQHNLISISAGPRGGALSLAFQGEIVNAYADFNQVPDPCMIIEASSGSYPQLDAATPTTVNGEAPAADLFSRFAEEAGYSFKNEGVVASVANAWFTGSAMDKIEKLARDIGCALFIDDGEVVVMPQDQAREGAPVLLSSATGMMGYPTFTNDGISCRCRYNPELRHGGLVSVKSIVPKATGTWRITRLSHHLSAYMPNGCNWESALEATYHE